MAWIGLWIVGFGLLVFGTAAALRPEATVEIQRTHGPGLFADADDEFVADMVTATPWVGGILAWLGGGLLLYLYYWA